jgi:hypothetical protein
MPEKRDQHFVPQFYLRHFGHGRYISVFNIGRRKHFHQASIRNQCQRPYYYGRDGKVDDGLTRLEDRVGPLLARIIATGRPPPIESDEHLALLEFVSFQRARTPAVAAMHEAMNTKMLRSLATSTGQLPDGDLAQLEMRLDNPVLHSVRLAPRHGPILMDLGSKLLVNDSPIEFVASDVGVTLTNTWFRSDHQGSVGLARAGLQIWLPLSPRQMLLLFDRGVYRLGQLGGRKEAKVVAVSQEDVVRLNTLVMFHAEENLYYSGDASTCAALDALPTADHVPAHKRVRLVTAVSEDGQEEMDHVYVPQPDFDPDLSFLHLHHRARRQGRRVFRPQADRMRDLLDELEGRAPRPRPGGVSRPWRVIRED